MNSIKKSSWIFVGSIILTISLMTGCTKSTSNDTKEKIVGKLCEELFTFPSENNNKVLEAMENPTGVSIIGIETENVEQSEEDNWKNALNEVYGKYFTEAELEDFYNDRVLLDILLAVKNQG